MGVRNRNVYARRRGTGGMGAVRDVLVLMVLAVLSFSLGFFVLARLMPDNHLPAPPEKAVAVAPTGSDDAKKTETTAAPETVPHKARSHKNRNTEPDAEVASKMPAKKTGPVLELDDETPAASPAETVPVRRKSTGRRADTVPAAPETPADPVQPPTQPGDLPVVTPNSETAAAHKRYRIQMGMYESREAAEQAAQQLLDKNIFAAIHTVQRNGTTFYSVEGKKTFRTRGKANAERRRLLAEGISEAVISEQKTK